MTRICPSCGAEYATQPHWNKVYCNVQCRNREKRQREKQRVIQAKPLTDSAIISEVNSPTENELNTIAQTLLSLKGDRVAKFKFVGFPWQPPNGITFVKQESGDWIMAYRPPSILDLI